MAIAYYGSTISPNMDKTPECYLICRNVPINRTGMQVYTAGEANLPGDPERPVNVYRLPEDVFAPAALASLEGKDVTRGHPTEMLDAGNQAGYSKGHMENVRRDGDNTVADLIIKDPALVSDVENGILREVSCGYYCKFEPYQDGYKQTHIIGNHLAVVPRGRAGQDVAIKDAAEQAEKGRNHFMNYWKSFLTAFGMAAKDAAPDELGQMADTAAAVLDAEPAKAPEAEPAKAEDTVPAAKDEMVEKAPKGDDLGSKLDRILEMLEAKSRGGRGEHPLHDESDIDEMIAKLAGEEPGEDKGKALTIPVEETEDCTGMDKATRDAAVSLLRKVRPAVAAIENKHDRAKVTDALLSAVRGQDNLSVIAQAAADSARANANQASKSTYEKICADSEANYAARNPHNKKEG